MTVPESPSPRLARISVIIPTLNGGQDFLRCLEGIGLQQDVGEKELIVLDSGSDDDTARNAEAAGAQVIPVERTRFNHGAVRDLGVRHATGEYLVFTVQDARPADASWLKFLVEPLALGAAAATSRILPRPEASPLSRRTALDSWMASDRPFEADPAHLDPGRLSPEDLKRVIRFDDISSAIRADVYEKVPFKPVAMSEDLQWGLDAFRLGYKLVFAPKSMVYHSHEYGPMGAYRRYRDDARANWEILGLRTRRHAGHALRGLLFETFRDLCFLAGKGPSALLRYGLLSPLLRGFQVLGQWRGSP